MDIYPYREGFEPLEYDERFYYFPFVSRKVVYRILRSLCLFSGDDWVCQEEFLQVKRQATCQLLGLLRQEEEAVESLLAEKGVSVGMWALSGWRKVRESRLPADLSDSVTAALLLQKGIMEAVWLADVLKDVGDIEFDDILRLQGLQRTRRWCERIVVSPNYGEMRKAVASFKKDPLMLFLSGGTAEASLKYSELEPEVIAKRRAVLELLYRKGDSLKCSELEAGVIAKRRAVLESL